jgi:hypothetical protein
LTNPWFVGYIAYLRQQDKINIKKYIDERLPEEYENCLVGLTAITKEAWNTSQKTDDRRQKIQALSLANYSTSCMLYFVKVSFMHFLQKSITRRLMIGAI